MSFGQTFCSLLVGSGMSFQKQFAQLCEDMRRGDLGAQTIMAMFNKAGGLANPSAALDRVDDQLTLMLRTVRDLRNKLPEEV